VCQSYSKPKVGRFLRHGVHPYTRLLQLSTTVGIGRCQKMDDASGSYRRLFCGRFKCRNIFFVIFMRSLSNLNNVVSMSIVPCLYTKKRARSLVFCYSFSCRRCAEVVRL